MPADIEDLETIESLTLIESVQPEVCEQRRQQLRARLRENHRNEKPSAEAWQDDHEPGETPTSFRFLSSGNAMEVDLEIIHDRVKVLKVIVLLTE